jgi:tellurite resistance protein TehA-like permease
MADSTGGVVVLLAFGVGCLALAVSSLRAGSWTRRLYGIEPEDDASARTNAAVLGLVGIGLFGLAGAIALDLPPKPVATATVLASALLCVVLGWLVAVRDRREMLTTPNVDRETARRLGYVSILCGVLVLPFAPLIWFGADEVVFVVVALGSSFVALLAVAFAYR